MSQKPKLLVDFCSYQAAKYAVEHWHYSKVMPVGKLVKFGVWEDDRFIGAVIYGRGAIYNIGSPFGLSQIQVVELVRVALDRHCWETSSIMAKSVKKFKAFNPGIRLIVSFADTKQGHSGVLYQASNWIYCGSIVDRRYNMFGQQLTHGRSLYAKYGTQSLEWIKNNVDSSASIEYQPPKHKYLYPLDKAMRRQIEPLAKPYPKRASVGEMESR